MQPRQYVPKPAPLSMLLFTKNHPARPARLGPRPPSARRRRAAWARRPESGTGVRRGFAFWLESGRGSAIINPGMSELDTIRRKTGFIIDMDGVVYHGNHLLPGTREFLEWLRVQRKKFLFLTNSSRGTPRELKQKMSRLGVSLEEDHFYTSAQATAAFLRTQQPGGSAFVIGDAGLTNALYQAGFTLNDVNPDYVVVGESSSYDYDKLTHAIRLVLKGARLIGTNPDLTGPTDKGLVPATGALISPIELCTGAKAYYIGKPNPLIMRHALKVLGCQREETAIIGDRMDTDIIAGLESEIETVLVLSGVTAREDLGKYAYRPHHVLPEVGAIVPG